MKRTERPKKKPLRDIKVNLAGVRFEDAVQALLKTPPPKEIIRPTGTALSDQIEAATVKMIRQSKMPGGLLHRTLQNRDD